MSSLQFKDDGSLGKFLDDIAGINNPDRQTVIHSTFEPQGHDSVKFKRTKTTREKLIFNETIWTSDDFAKRFATMDRLATELGRVIANLKPYTPGVDFSDPRNSQYLALL
jgi:hypothetical protein